jgi:hypothetical protein
MRRKGVVAGLCLLSQSESTWDGKVASRVVSVFTLQYYNVQADNFIVAYLLTTKLWRQRNSHY